jgi:hypothetical protein
MHDWNPANTSFWELPYTEELVAISYFCIPIHALTLANFLTNHPAFLLLQRQDGFHDHSPWGFNADTT